MGSGRSGGTPLRRRSGCRRRGRSGRSARRSCLHRGRRLSGSGRIGGPEAVVLIHASLVPVCLALLTVIGLRVRLAVLSAVSVLTFALSRRSRRGTVSGGSQRGGDADAGDEQSRHQRGPRNHDLHSLHTLPFISLDGQGTRDCSGRGPFDALRSPLRCKSGRKRFGTSDNRRSPPCSLKSSTTCLDRRASHDGGVDAGRHAVRHR
jgi:hypothetical protein